MFNIWLCLVSSRSLSFVDSPAHPLVDSPAPVIPSSADPRLNQPQPAHASGPTIQTQAQNNLNLVDSPADTPSRAAPARCIQLRTVVLELYGNDEYRCWQDIFQMLSNDRKRTGSQSANLLTFIGFAEALQHYSANAVKTKRRNSVVISFYRAIFAACTGSCSVKTAVWLRSTQSSAIGMYRSIVSLVNGTRGMKAASNRCSLPAFLPSTAILKEYNRQMIREFMHFCDPVQTMTGFRVDLVKYFRFILFIAYDVKDPAGVWADMWGDGMNRGGIDITRFGIKITLIPGEDPADAQKRAQSPDHLFMFLVYTGKDSRVAMEMNTYDGGFFGDRGWLYSQTKQLHDMRVHLTCSGDAPFLCKFIGGIQTDSQNSLAELAMHVDDPPEHVVMSIDAKLKNGNPKGYDVKTDPQRQIELEDAGAVLPQSVNRVTHKRTDLVYKLRVKLPELSLVYLENNLCFCPDPLHGCIRMCENDIRRHGQHLLTIENKVEFEKLAENLTLRDVKSPRFSWPMNGTNVAPLSFSGSEAAVILAHRDHLIEGGLSDNTPHLFEGVYFYDRRIASKMSANSVQVLLQMHPYLEKDASTFKDGRDESGVSERDLAELQVQSLSESICSLRATTFDAVHFKLWYETYYQCTLTLFGPAGLTSYKLKMDCIWRIHKEGFISDPRVHLCEGGEHTNHTANGEFFGHSTRNGGNILYQHDANFKDIMFSRNRVIHLGVQLYPQMEHEERMAQFANLVNESYPSPQNTETYLGMVTKPLQMPVLEIGRNVFEKILLGMRFTIVDHYSDIKVKGASGRTIGLTQPIIETLIKSMGGLMMSDTMTTGLSEKHAFLPQCYCVMKNPTMLETYISSYPNHDCSKMFHEIAKGDWKFLSYTFLYACSDQRKLLDPEPYLFKIADTDIDKFVKYKSTDISNMLLRQRCLPPPDANGNYIEVTTAKHNLVRANTALKRFRKRKSEELELAKLAKLVCLRACTIPT
jgi:hypothetical protein